MRENGFVLDKGAAYFLATFSWKYWHGCQSVCNVCKLMQVVVTDLTYLLFLDQVFERNKAWIHPLGVSVSLYWLQLKYGECHVGSTQPFTLFSAKIRCLPVSPVENPKEKILINHFYLKYLLLDQEWKCETYKLSILYNLQFSFSSATPERDLSRVYNWQLNIYQTEEPGCSFN